MIAGGLVWLAVALSPVLFLADKTMRHNLYVPLLGVSAIMGLAVNHVYNCARSRGRRLAKAWLVYFCAAYVTGSALAGVGYRRHGWPVKASVAAENSLNDMMKAHPTLPPETTLYFLDNRRDDLIWFFEGGNLFRIFYRDSALRTLFQQSGDELPPGFMTDERFFLLAYYDGHLYDVTEQHRAEALDRRSVRLMEQFGPQLVSFDGGEWYVLKNYLNTPREDSAFVYPFARDGHWRNALITVAGASVAFRTAKVEQGWRLRIGAAMPHDLGDGAEGKITFESRGRKEVIYRRLLDPAANPGDRRWFDDMVDLSRFAGEDGTLRLECGPGPSGDPAADWFGWSVLKIERNVEM
jgi:hypothetical protein